MDPEFARTLDDALTPLTQSMHKWLYLIQCSSKTMGDANSGMQMEAVTRLIEAQKVLEPINGNGIPAKSMHAAHCIINAGIAVKKAQAGVAVAIRQIAEALDSLTDEVRDRSREMFLEAMENRATRVDCAPFTSGECFYCCEPVSPENAAWLKSDACRHNPPVSCKACLVMVVYEGTGRCRKSFVRCPLCRAECTLDDVKFTGNALQ